MSLFRKEAISHQSERLTGAITLAQPLSIKLTTLILVAVALAVVTFLFNAEYSRKEAVRGFLMPNKGVIKSFASQGGTIEKLWVREGEIVEEGQRLVTLVDLERGSDGIALSEKLIEQLNNQFNLLATEISQHQAIKVTELNNLNSKYSGLTEEQKALEAQLVLANEKLALLNTQQTNVERLSREGFVSGFDKERQQQALLDAKQEKQNIMRLLLQQKNNIIQTQSELANLPQRYTLQINHLKRQQADLERQLARVKNEHRYTVTASHSGTVTGIQVVAGETLKQAKPLLHILPKGSELVAEILLPTRSAGFIEQGQVARLRFDAFPYQRFGFIQGEITRIDRALISPNEVELPIVLQEPVYRLRASMERQGVQAYGKSFELKSGMLFEADILLEQRTLIEWLLEPIYSLKGRVS